MSSPTPPPAVPDGAIARWEDWPRNSRNFRLAIDDADEVCSHFCPNLECGDCSHNEAIHASLYSRSGEPLLDGKVSAADFPAHLEAVGDLGRRSSNQGDEPHYRLYFPADCGTEDVMSTRFMRQFLSHYQVPADVALAFTASRLDVGFHTYTEEVDAGANQPPRKILHYWLKCSIQLMADDIRSHVDLFSEERRSRILNRGPGRYSIIHDPALYMQYDCESGQCVLLCTEYAGLFYALQQTCRTAVQMRLDQDPFVFWAVLLKRILDPTRRTAVAWRREIYHMSDTLAEGSRDTSNLYYLLDKFTNDGIAYSRVADAMQCIVRDIADISKAHYAARGAQSGSCAAFTWVERYLEEQRRLAAGTEMLFRDCADSANSYSDRILGYSQLRNAYAMKTVTYLTLVFLPATFVSTLFSMGIFNFGTDTTPGGQITIARHGWVYLAVALPMTLVTLALAYLWMRMKVNGTLPSKQDERMRRMQHRRNTGAAIRIALSGQDRDVILAALRQSARAAEPEVQSMEEPTEKATPRRRWRHLFSRNRRVQDDPESAAVVNTPAVPLDATPRGNGPVSIGSRDISPKASSTSLHVGTSA